MMKSLQEAGYIFDTDRAIWQRPGYVGIPYSDGDEVEQRIAGIIERAEDVSSISTELRRHCTDWPSLYHLTSLRANILRPFQQHLKGDILEIGSGCGAITRFLGERDARVLALEGSPRRASIARSRARGLENVHVLSETFDRFECDIKFDVITLIGVLEYANIFVEGENPPLGMLTRIRSMLKDDGILVVAIENQVGLKYFAGAPEDHLGEPMYGIEGRYLKDQPQTFGRAMLTRLLNLSGFQGVEVLAPFPDYKLPVSVLTQRGFETEDFDAAAFAWQSVRRDPQLPQLLSFSPELAWPVIVENGLGLDLANSFLIGARALEHPVNSTLAWHFSSDRREQFCKKTTFVKENGSPIEVHCEALSPTALRTGDQPGLLTFDISKAEKYQSGRNYSYEFIKIVSKNAWSFDDVDRYLREYISLILSEASLGENSGISSAQYINVPGAFFDYVPQNIIHGRDGKFYIIDKEWTYNKELTIGFLIYRFISSHLNSFSSFGASADGFCGSRTEFIINCFDALGWKIDFDGLRQYFLIEREIQLFVTGWALDWEVYSEWLESPSSPLHAQLRDAAVAEEEAATERAYAKQIQQDLVSTEITVSEQLRTIQSNKSSINELQTILARQIEVIDSNKESIALLEAEALLRESELASQYSAIERLEFEYSHLQSKLSEREADVERMAGKLRDQNVLLEEKDGQIAYRARAIDEILSSTSWRITAPIRRIVERFRNSSAHQSKLARIDEMMSFVLEPKPIRVSSNSVVVILPVYKDVQLTLDCIASCLPGIRSVPRGKLLIINDCSPDSGMQEALDEIQAANSKIVEVVANPRNLGFVKTVNLGLRSAKSADVVLLNSDVILPADWLARLRREAYSHPDVGTVTPISNNTTICTFPEFLQDNPLPLGLSVHEIDSSFAEERLPNVIAPTGIGFCMYIREDCLKSVGLLRAEHFPRGYGEENDFCQRAIGNGWLNIITPNLFAYHKGGVSFGSEKDGLIANALQTIDRLHPQYHFDVQRFIQSDPLKIARLVRLVSLARQQRIPKILHIIHSLGGGTRQHVAELGRYLSEYGKAFSVVIEPTDDAGKYVLTFGHSEHSDSIAFELDNNYESVILLLKKLDITVVHFHHLLGVHDKLKDLPAQLNVDYYFTVHDYYMISGNPTLTNEHGCFNPLLPYEASNPLHSTVPVDSIPEFRQQSFAFLKNAEKVIFPSAAAKTIFEGIFTLNNGIIAHHIENTRPIPREKSGGILPVSGITVGVLGALSKEKGADLLEEVACRSRERGLPLNFKLVGYAYRPLNSIVTTGPYLEAEASTILERENIDVLLFTARWPETYSYTLSTAIQSKIPILAPTVGAFPERLSGHVNAELYTLDAHVDEIIDQLVSFCEKIRAGTLTGVSNWSGARAELDFYDTKYLMSVISKPQKPGRVSTSSADIVLRLMKDEPEVWGKGWPHTIWRRLCQLYRIPGMLYLKDRLPASMKLKIKRYIIKFIVR